MLPLKTWLFPKKSLSYEKDNVADNETSFVSAFTSDYGVNSTYYETHTKDGSGCMLCASDISLKPSIQTGPDFCIRDFQHRTCCFYLHSKENQTAGKTQKITEFCLCFINNLDLFGCFQVLMEYLFQTLQKSVSLFFQASKTSSDLLTLLPTESNVLYRFPWLLE